MAGERMPEIDAATKTPLMSHEWDGLRELNTPLPRWWVWIFYATIIWSIGYWIVYPAWPLMTSFTSGMFGWHSRQAVVQDLDALKAQRAGMSDRIAAASLQDINADNQLREFARAQGRAAFADNCAPCHGSGAGGAKGYPNLIDDDWLWGGKLEDLVLTIRHGVRSGDDKGRTAPAMPAFGRDNMLPRDDIETVASYARSLSGLPVEPGVDLKRGAKIFADNCAVCHGPNGTGNREVGAPNLTDKIWLYSPAKAVIVEGLTNGRGGVMPAWGVRLDDTTIKALSVYVYSLGGGEK